MDEFVFEIVSELFLFGFVPLVATVAAVWAFWNVLETIDPNEIKSIQSFLTVIVVIVPFAMLVFYGLAVVMYDELVTASGSQAAEAYFVSRRLRRSGEESSGARATGGRPAFGGPRRSNSGRPRPTRTVAH